MMLAQLVVVLGGMLVGSSSICVTALLPSVTNASEASSQSCVGWHIRVLGDAE